MWRAKWPLRECCGVMIERWRMDDWQQQMSHPMRKSPLPQMNQKKY